VREGKAVMNAVVDNLVKEYAQKSLVELLLNSQRGPCYVGTTGSVFQYLTMNEIKVFKLVKI
jgi:hypothetical protein